MFQAHAIFYPDLLEEHLPLRWFLHGCRIPGEPTGRGQQFRIIQTHTLGSLLRTEERLLAKTFCQTSNQIPAARRLLGDRTLQALRRGRWGTPAELETRHWESHSFVAHSSCTAVSFKQSLLNVT